MGLRDVVKTITGSESRDDLAATDAALRGELAGLDAEERLLLSLPAPPEEVIGNVRRLVAAAGDAWLQAHAVELVEHASGRVEHHVEPPRLRPPQLPPCLSGALTFDAAAAIMPAAIVDGLARVVNGMQYRAGAPMAGRLDRLAAIADRRAALHRQHRQLVETAAAKGLTLDHLPAEAGRRYRNQQKLDAWDRDRRDNRKLYEQQPHLAPARPVLDE
jgi:hypothetical protein